MRAFARFLMLATLALVVPAVGETCELNINLFNHKINGNELRLYMEMQPKNPVASSNITLDPAKFDTVHNPGDGQITSVASYGKVGNGLGTLLMLDRSASMASAQAAEKRAAIEYIDSMDQNDEIALFFFTQERREYPFSSAPGELRQKVQTEMPGDNPPPMQGGETPLYKHIIDGVDYVRDHTTKELAFVLVMSDGEETIGGFSEEDVIQRAREKRVGIFAVGFYIKKKDKKTGKWVDNLPQLQRLEKIATATGGKYVQADASSNLGGIFVDARRRAREFVVIDEKLCGMTRDQAVNAKRMETEVRYADCKSNNYSMPIPPIEKDLEACVTADPANPGDPNARPDCPKGQKWNPEKKVCELVECNKCKEVVEVKKECKDGKCGDEPCVDEKCKVDWECVDKKCTDDKECAEGCKCKDGICGEKPPCEDWQDYNQEAQMCVGTKCSKNNDCPENYECCSSKCAAKKECAAHMTKDKDSCACSEIECKYDAQCPSGSICDGAICADTGGAKLKQPKCEGAQVLVNDECKDLECKEDKDCDLGKDFPSMVCASKTGLGRDEKTSICQEVTKGPCEKWEEEVEGGCRIVACKDDGDCPEGTVCGEEDDQCKEADIIAQYGVWIAVGLAVLAAIAFLAMALRKKPAQNQYTSRNTTSPRTENEGPRPERHHQPTDLGSGSAKEPEPQHQPAQDRRRAPVDGTYVDPNIAVQQATAGTAGVVMVINYADGRQASAQLRNGVQSVGRSDADIIIDDPLVSSNHLTLNVTSSGIVLTDLGSTNRTFLNGRELPAHQPTPVDYGQTVKLASSVTLTFRGPGQNNRSAARNHTTI